jgi:RHS repeat-associated protein
MFFDNLQVSHIKGAVLEETHYYPFGLVMAGISAKGVGKVENKKKYNGYEESKDFDLNLYETFYRLHDPQLGRFWQLDPKPNDFEGLYTAMGNNPIKFNDLLGDTTIFYNTSGAELLKETDGNKYATLTVIPDNNLGAFQLGIEDNLPVATLRKNGISYDTKEYFDYFDSHAKDFNTNPNIYEVDGKGKLVNENMAVLDPISGSMKIRAGSNNSGSPVSSTTLPSNTGPYDIHTHTTEGRKIATKWSDGRVTVDKTESGRAALGDVRRGDLSRTNENSKGSSEGKFRVVVSKNTIYLYKNGQIVIQYKKK